ncbi:MAG: septation protein A [Gammaproteobacteria bacterium]|nr:septation protein A [Gammaproteobacteria bacterium]
MQLLFDFLPVIAFFVAYKLADIYIATGVIIVATVLQVAIHWLRTRCVNPMHVVSAVLILVFGGLTLALHDALFVMWKPTVVNWLFALAFLASQLPVFGGRPLVERLMNLGDAKLELAPALWRRLNLIWVGYFALMGVANLLVFRYFDEATWVNFKLFGMLGLTLAFIVGQGFWIAAQMRDHGTAGH